MKKRTITLSVLALPFLLTPIGVVADAPAIREELSADQMRRISGEIFPTKCGTRGERCAFVRDADYCPLQFVISFPSKEVAADEPQSVWVTLSERGAILEVGSRRSNECRNPIAS